MKILFSPLSFGAFQAPNRVFMAPLTRCRAGEAHLPNALMARYYAQRASAGLIVAEATMIQPRQSAFWKEPGIYSFEQIEGWRGVTEAVHAAGGRIVLQIWHGGRACHPLLNQGARPVAPSAIAIPNDQVYTPEGKQPYVTPRALRDDELPEIVAAFRQAARNARLAGFDGVEVHAANGYLLDEFLRDGSNKRAGAYGGGIPNRAKLLLDTLDAVCAEVGADRVGVRVSPLNSFNSMIDSDPVALYTWLASRLNDYHLAYLHVMRADFLQQQSGDILTPIREHFSGVLVGNMGYSATEAAKAISAGTLDAVAFGTAFLANPDLPARFLARAPLNEPNAETFYSEGAEGYTDYPVWEGA